MRRLRQAAVALGFGAATLGALPLSSSADIKPVSDLQQRLAGALAPKKAAPPATSTPAAPSVGDLELLRRLEEARRKRQAAADDPKTNPPLHGTNPHGQGTVGVVDTTPSNTRPLGGNPSGSDSGEEIVVGRARGERQADGAYHGRITIVGLFGAEILGVNTTPGESVSGPLSAVQNGVLTPICNGSGQQVCLSAVTADSSTTGTGSTNRFSAAHATIGGPTGIDVGAAESNGNLTSDSTCQTARGDSSVASAKVGGQAVADAAQSTSDSKACKGQPATQTNTSRVIALGGVGVPLPAPGCANGTADVLTGIPVVAPIVCGADDSNGTQADAPYGVRDALSVFALDAGGATLLKTTTAGSESRAVAPPPQCSDSTDNDGDGKVDASDPGCLSGPGGAYNPNDDNEADEGGKAPDEGGKAECSDSKDNDGDGKVDARDPGCHSDGNPNNPDSFNPNDDDEADNGSGNKEQCSDGKDNDGDGKADAKDPGCHSDGNPNNPDSYNPNDDNEGGGGGGGGDGGGGGTPASRELGSNANSGQLPFTGTNVVLIVIAGLLLVGGGLELRSRTRLERAY